MLGKLRLQPNERASIKPQLARRVPLPQKAATDGRAATLKLGRWALFPQQQHNHV